jgi:hypothetical protein
MSDNQNCPNCNYLYYNVSQLVDDEYPFHGCWVCKETICEKCCGDFEYVYGVAAVICKKCCKPELLLHA